MVTEVYVEGVTTVLAACRSHYFAISLLVSLESPFERPIGHQLVCSWLETLLRTENFSVLNLKP